VLFGAAHSYCYIHWWGEFWQCALLFLGNNLYNFEKSYSETDSKETTKTSLFSGISLGDWFNFTGA
jgi:hypothetical protein